jgi:hypothetical protein
MTACAGSILLSSFGSVLTVFAVSGFAQTNTGAVQHSLLRSSANVTRVYVAAHSAEYEDVQLAPNFMVTSLFRGVIDQMLSRSPTFRRQCARIASASNLTIELSSVPARTDLHTPASTRIERRPGGRLHAAMAVAPVGRSAELIAHELEHVIEQLDGISLREKAQVVASGVRHCNCDGREAFETTRAILTGLRVAAEVGERAR